MVNGFLELMKARKTTYEFSSRKVSDAAVKAILEAARWCPSSHNTQNWSFIVVKDKPKIERLINICYYGFFHTSPDVIIAIILEPIYTKEQMMQGLLRGGWKEFASYHKYMNIGMPALTIAYAAKSLGIDSCILSPVVKEANKTLGVPQTRKTVLLLGLGYENTGAHKKPRTRKEYKQIVFNARYGTER